MNDENGSRKAKIIGTSIAEHNKTCIIYCISLGLAQEYVTIFSRRYFCTRSRRPAKRDEVIFARALKEYIMDCLLCKHVHQK